MVKNQVIYLIFLLLIILYSYYPNKIYNQKKKTKILRKIDETNNTNINITTYGGKANYIKDNQTIVSIDLGDCEWILKMVYNILIEEALIIHINKITPEVEYEVYYKSKQLNMSYCEDIIIEIIYPTSINTGNKINISLSMNVDIINKINNLIKNEKNEI